MRQLGLRGLNIPASMLSGWSLRDLDKLRDYADKAACPCLVLYEETPLTFGHYDPARAEEALVRTRNLAAAAHRMGCNSLSLTIQTPFSESAFESCTEAIKQVMPSIERSELNVLLAPEDMASYTPERLTELIKQIGGFRIGSLPTFSEAGRTGDIVQTLRMLAPYAGAIHASIEGFNSKGVHTAYDLAACVSAVKSVGFLNTLAIEYLGDGDPLENIDQARIVLQNAIDADD